MARLPVAGLLLSLSLAAQTGPAEHASVFAREGDAPEADATKPLFTFERTITITNGQTVADVRFRDRAGDVAVTERVTYAGQLLVRHELVQHQVDERYAMTVSGDNAVFEIERNGEMSRTRHDWTPDTLIVDQIRPHVAAHWNRLMRGEEISFRLVALARARIVRFTLKHRETTERRGRPAVVIRMQAGSVFVRWFAPEIDMVFANDGRTLLESRGPLPVKIRRGNGWVDLDARMVWDIGSAPGAP